MINSNELLAAMVRKGYNNKTAAELIGVSPNTYGKKLRGLADFTVGEAQTLVQAFGIDDPASIFFAETVPNMQQH